MTFNIKQKQLPIIIFKKYIVFMAKTHNTIEKTNKKILKDSKEIFLMKKYCNFYQF